MPRSEVKLLSHVQLFATSWTVAYWAPLSMGFSRQEYWSRLPFPSPGDLPNPGIEPGLPHWKQMLYPLNHQGSHDYGPTFTSVFSIMSFSDAMIYEIPHQWIKLHNPWVVVLAKSLPARKTNR